MTQLKSLGLLDWVTIGHMDDRKGPVRWVCKRWSQFPMDDALLSVQLCVLSGVAFMFWKTELCSLSIENPFPAPLLYLAVILTMSSIISRVLCNRRSMSPLREERTLMTAECNHHLHAWHTHMQGHTHTRVFMHVHAGRRTHTHTSVLTLPPWATDGTVRDGLFNFLWFDIIALTVLVPLETDDPFPARGGPSLSPLGLVFSRQ